MQTRVTDPLLRQKPIQGDAVSYITTNQHGIPYIPVVFENINNSNTFGFRNNSEMQLSIKKVQILGYLGLRSKDGSLAEVQWLIPMNHQLHEYILYGHIFASILEHQNWHQRILTLIVPAIFFISPLPAGMHKSVFS